MDTNALNRAEALQKRAKQLGLRTVRVFQALPRAEEARIIGRQLLRAGTSVGANYRAACRARSMKEFASKLGVVVEECDESCYWIDLLMEAGIVSQRRLSPLLAETEELLRIFSASHTTARRKLKRR